MRAEGLELTENLRELSSSLKANAERLLRDVLRVHVELTSRIDAIDPAPLTPHEPAHGGGAGGHGGDDELEVPEFIPGAR